MRFFGEILRGATRDIDYFQSENHYISICFDKSSLICMYWGQIHRSGISGLTKIMYLNGKVRKTMTFATKICRSVALCSIGAAVGLVFTSSVLASVLGEADIIEPRIDLARLDTSIVAPTARPEPIFMLPQAPEEMVLPESRPDRRSLFKTTDINMLDTVTRLVDELPRFSRINGDVAKLRLKSGEGLAQLLKRGGFSATDAQNAITMIRHHQSLRSLPIGYPVEVLKPSEHNSGALRVPLDDDFDLTLALLDSGSWASEITTRPIRSITSYVSGRIDSSLYKAGMDAGMTEAVFNTFVQVLGFSVDFQREIREGDRFEALFETKQDMITGETKPGATLHFLSMTLSDQRIDFFRHVHQDGTEGFYDEAGNSASRTLMRTPINGARLASGYGKRRHPVLGYSKIHRGADFAAPTGTPIMAAGSGVIEYAGWNGSYGKYVRLRHHGTYKTAYAHLSRISKAISPGTRVSQGQIIGRVGSTGRSTGPHLHYEIIVSGRKVNPMTVRLPAGRSMPENEREPFRKTLASIEGELISRGVTRFASE